MSEGTVSASSLVNDSLVDVLMMMMMRLFDRLGFVQLVKQSQDDGADDVVEWRVSPTAERLQAASASASAQLSSDEGAFLCPISLNVNHPGGAIHKILSREFEQARTPSKKKVCLFFSFFLSVCHMLTSMLHFS